MYDPTGHQPGAVPSRVLTALRSETKRLDALDATGVVCSGGNIEAAPAGLSDLPTPERRSVRVSFADEIDMPGPASFSRLRAELAQRRAEAALNILAATTQSPGPEAAAHAADMAAATLAAAQALLSAHVLWRARAEYGGLTVPASPLSAVSDDERGA